MSNVEALERAGLVVPETGTRDHKIVHHDLASEYQQRNGAQPTPLFTKLREELISKGYPERIIISSEGFEFKIGRADKRRLLMSFFSDLGYRLRVIAYVRPQDAYMNSSYAQMTKFLADLGSFEDYTAKTFRLARFDYSRHLLPLFDDPDVTAVLRPFNRDTLARTIEADFLSVLGLSPEEAARIELAAPSNETPGSKTIAACRTVVARLAAQSIELSTKQRNGAGRFIREVTDSAGWNITKFNALSPEIASSIHRRFAESNAKFARAAWRREWSEVFAHELAREVVQNVYDPEIDSDGGRQEFSRITEEIIDWILKNTQPRSPIRFWRARAFRQRIGRKLV